MKYIRHIRGEFGALDEMHVECESSPDMGIRVEVTDFSPYGIATERSIPEAFKQTVPAYLKADIGLELKRRPDQDRGFEVLYDNGADKRALTEEEERGLKAMEDSMNILADCISKGGATTGLVDQYLELKKSSDTLTSKKKPGCYLKIFSDEGGQSCLLFESIGYRDAEYVDKLSRALTGLMKLGQRTRNIPVQLGYESNSRLMCNVW